MTACFTVLLGANAETFLPKMVGVDVIVVTNWYDASMGALISKTVQGTQKIDLLILCDDQEGFKNASRIPEDLIPRTIVVKDSFSNIDVDAYRDVFGITRVANDPTDLEAAIMAATRQ